MKNLLSIISCSLFFSYYCSAQIISNSSSTLTSSGTTPLVAAGVGPIDPAPTIADRVKFTYDESGNQIERKLCINCTTNRISNPNPSEPIIENVAEKADEKIIEDKLTFYPNPVKEELHIDFDLSDSSKRVSKVEVYALTGQIIKIYTHIENQTNLIVPFNNLPQGMYLVNVIYTDGEIVDLKIQKK
jgi:Secretion system C-terminal sorting domain